MKFSLAQLVVGMFVLAMVLAVFIPPVKVNAKSDASEWTSTHEQTMRKLCPPISPAELSRK